MIHQRTGWNKIKNSYQPVACAFVSMEFVGNPLYQSRSTLIRLMIVEQCRSTAGMVARNDRGEVLASKATINNEMTSPFVVEASACSQAVVLGLEIRVDRIEIEGDALAVIKKCQKKPSTN